MVYCEVQGESYIMKLFYICFIFLTVLDVLTVSKERQR